MNRTLTVDWLIKGKLNIIFNSSNSFVVYHKDIGYTLNLWSMACRPSVSPSILRSLNSGKNSTEMTVSPHQVWHLDVSKSQKSPPLKYLVFVCLWVYAAIWLTKTTLAKYPWVISKFLLHLIAGVQSCLRTSLCKKKTFLEMLLAVLAAKHSTKRQW